MTVYDNSICVVIFIAITFIRSSVTHTKQVIRNWFAGTYTHMYYTGVQYSHAVTAVAVNTDYICTM